MYRRTGNRRRGDDHRRRPDPYAPILALNPLWSYRPLFSLVTLDGSDNVSRIADETDPTNATKDLLQTTEASRPAWLASSSAPTGVPAIRGDGLVDILGGSAGNALSAANLYTIYALLVCPTTLSGSESAVGIGRDDGLQSWVGLGPMGVGRFATHRRSGPVGSLQTATVVAAGETVWIEGAYNPATVMNVSDSSGGANSAAAPGTFSGSQYLLSLCGAFGVVAGGLPSEFSDAEVLAYVGWNSILSAPDRAIVGAALSAYGGI
jgi:hypothetical protein